MKQIFNFFIDNYKLTFVFTAMLIVGGLMGLRELNSEAFPPVDFAIAKISTIYPGSSPEEVEEQITQKLEDEIRTLDGIRDMKSTSQSERSDIVVRIDMDNVDSRQVMDEIQRAVQRVGDLPPGILEDPVIDEVKSEEMPIIELGLAGPQKNRERDELADRLKDQLEDIPGVASVRLDGFQKREFQILLDPNRMRRLHVGIPEVLTAVQKRSQNIPAGYIRSSGEQNLVRVLGEVRSAEEMGEIVVRSNFTGQKIRVKDVADVKDGAEEGRSRARVNGEPATILVVRKKAKSDAIEVVDGISTQLEVFRKSLPSEYSVTIFNNEGSRIKDKLGIVVSNSVFGLILVLVILLIFLPGKMGVLTSLSLPLAILGTVSLAPSLGLAFNTITMLALVIAIGMLVDNSVVISENYARLRGEGIPPRKAAQQAVGQFWLPITATAMTTIAAFLPMLVTKGIMGEFIKYIPITVTVALLMSLFESLFILPARLQFSLTDKVDSPEEGEARLDPPQAKKEWFDSVKNRFIATMEWGIGRRYLVATLFGALLLGSLALAAFGNRFELFPAESVEIYLARIEASDTATLSETEALTAKVSNQVREKLSDLGLTNIAARVGFSSKGPDDPQTRNGDNVAMLGIYIDRDTARRQNTHLILDKLREIEKGSLKKLSFESVAPGPPVGKALNLTFRSNRYEELRSFADEMIAEISKIPGVTDVEDDEVRGVPEYAIQLDYERLASLRLDTQAVGLALRTALQGAVVSKLSLDGDEVDLRIRYGDSYRETIRALNQTEILEPSGNLIPLSTFAKITQSAGPSTRKHFDVQRAITITGDVNPEVITSVVLNAKAKKLYEQMQVNYPGVSSKFGGEEENTKESVDSLFSAMIVAVFGIFAILVFMFRSFLKPLLILSTIPLGLIGVSWAFFLHGKPLSFLALIGSVGLAGVVVNSGIVLMSYIDDVMAEGKLSLHDVLVKASATRLRAVIVTSLTTVGGLLPTAYGIGGYDALLVPMTLALAWGLVSGTLLTLVWVPCGVAILDDLEGLVARWRGKPRSLAHASTVYPEHRSGGPQAAPMDQMR